MSQSENDNRRIIIFDTTLRDGEQSPGASMNLPEKMEVAQALVDLGVDVIEAGFPIASPGDYEAVYEISNNIKGATICGLARCRQPDIDRAWDALKHADQGRIHVFLATSTIHREFKLRMSQEDILERMGESLRYAASLCDDIEFSPEDAVRTEIDFLCAVVEKAIASGAKTVNIPDTVGYATPRQMYDVIDTLYNRVPNIDQAVIAIHCHNDLGMAVANTLSAIEAGAGQIECTINGIGERAGNCALEEVVMAMRTRNDYYRTETGINTPRLVPISQTVSRITGLHVQRNKSIVGRNAFAHESGIHQDGMLKNPTTYEIMRPEDVGWAATDLVLGKHSGRAALADRARALGHDLTNEQLVTLFEDFKVLADKKKEVYDADLLVLIEQQTLAVSEEWSFESYQVKCGTDMVPTIQLALRHGDQIKTAEMTCGDGPIDAVILAIEELTGLDVVCKDFNVHSVTIGQDAQGEVTMQLEYQGELYRGRGTSTDSVEASALAMLAAVNRILASNAPEQSAE